MSKSFFSLLKNTSPLKIVGAVNAYSALLAERAGLKALYISGAGVANASYGIPDLAMTSKDNVLEDLRRIRGATDLPVLVDCDTGWGSALSISKTVKDMILAGANGIHIEDQVSNKRCGHRPNKEIVSDSEMMDRLKAAKDRDEFLKVWEGFKTRVNMVSQDHLSDKMTKKFSSEYKIRPYQYNPIVMYVIFFLILKSVVCPSKHAIRWIKKTSRCTFSIFFILFFRH